MERKEACEGVLRYREGKWWNRNWVWDGANGGKDEAKRLSTLERSIIHPRHTKTHYKLGLSMCGCECWVGDVGWWGREGLRDLVMDARLHKPLPILQQTPLDSPPWCTPPAPRAESAQWRSAAASHCSSWWWTVQSCFPVEAPRRTAQTYDPSFIYLVPPLTDAHSRTAHGITWNTGGR